MDTNNATKIKTTKTAKGPADDLISLDNGSNLLYTCYTHIHE